MRRALIATFGALLLGAAPADAATFQVTTLADSADCSPPLPCSLRGALLAAQANGAAEDDVINLPAGTYGVPELALSGVNASRITVNGAGANGTIIQPSGQTRVFTLGQGAGLTLRGVTVQGGRPTSGIGGNIQVISARLALEGSTVRDGQTAAGGGGIGAQSLSAIAELTITRSLIAGNAALVSANGGGLSLLAGTAGGVAATITDSTIAYNTSPAAGAGINSTSGAAQAPTLRGVTVAFNTATTGAGGIQSSASAATIQGSIFAGNRGANNGIHNCTFNGTVTDQGGNVSDPSATGNCGFTNPASRPNTNPQLVQDFDGSQPPALPLPATSPAVDLADCGGRTLDQRGVPRPQGLRCDAGAYEFDPAPDTAIAGAAPPFTFTATDPGSTFECSLDGGAFAACPTPYDPGAAPGTHTLAVRAVDPQGNRDPSPATVSFSVAAPVTPTPTATPTATPTPVVNRTIVVQEARGTVRIKLPGSRRYVDLDATRGIPVGSTVDTRKGRVRLTSVPKAGARPETALFYDGLFRVTQSKGITNLTLTEALAKCSSRARAAAKKAKKRRLWGDGKGSFRTTGRYSAATVRGTKWLVEDSCAGTLTRVTQGSVRVRHRGRTIVVRAGKRYLARPRR